jgi:hypothetical protein
MNRTVKRIGSFAKVTFEHQLSHSMPGQCVQLDGKMFAIYETTDKNFSIFVKDNSHFVENTPKTISEPTGQGFSAALFKRAIVVAGGTGIGAIMPVIKIRNKYGLSTDVIFYTKDDVSSIRADQATIGMCRNVIFWNTTANGRPADPLQPLVEKQPESAVFVAGPRSLVEATEKISKKFNFECHTNF